MSETLVANRSFARWFLPTFLLAFLGLFFATLSDYGITWDEALGDLYLGDSYFYFLKSWDYTFLDLSKDSIPVYRYPDHPNFFETSDYVRDNTHHAWGFGPTLLAATKYLFYTQLGWFDPIDAHHIALGLLIAVQTIVLFFFTRRYFGNIVAAAAVLFLVTYPRYWAHLHNNHKDIPEAVFYVLVIVSFVYGVRESRHGLLALSAVLWGLALATKANALFLPFILAPWFVHHCVRRFWAGERSVSWQKPLLLFLYPIIGCSVAIVAWPFLLLDFPMNLAKHLSFLRFDVGLAGEPHWQITPLRNALVTMPLSILFLGVSGLVVVLWDFFRSAERRDLHLLVLLWMCIPVARVCMPYAYDHDVIRHWLEFIPALVIVAGQGAQAWLSLLFRFGKRFEMLARYREGFAVALILLYLSPIIVWNVVNHPFQVVFYNSLIGGYGGAKQQQDWLATSDYWGSSYRAGLKWLNENATEKSTLVVPVAPHIVWAVERIWLNDNIETAPFDWWENIRYAKRYGRDLYAMYFTREEFYPWGVRERLDLIDPVYEVKVDGGIVLRIIKLHDASARS